MAKHDPKKPNRDENVVVRVTTSEKLALFSAASKRGVTLSTLARGALIRALHDAPSSNLVAG